MRKRGLATIRNQGNENNRSLKLDLPQQTIDVIRYIQDEFQKPVWLLGLRGLYSLGVRVYRNAEEISIYSPITKGERSDLDDYLRDKYQKIVGRRTDLGTSYFFPHGCLLDVNRVDGYIERYYGTPEGRRENRIEISSGVFVQVPEIEDLLIMKLLKGRTKDLRDVKHIITTSRSWIDTAVLENRAREAGVELQLKRLQRIAS